MQGAFTLAGFEVEVAKERSMVFSSPSLLLFAYGGEI